MLVLVLLFVFAACPRETKETWLSWSTTATLSAKLLTASTCRADIPRVAADVTGLRLHRRRHHPAVPAQHLHRGQPVRQREPAHPAPPWQAPGRRVPRHQHTDPLPGLSQVLPGAEVHHTRQVPSEPGHGHPGFARGAGAYGDILDCRRCSTTELGCEMKDLVDFIWCELSFLNDDSGPTASMIDVKPILMGQDWRLGRGKHSMAPFTLGCIMRMSCKYSHFYDINAGVDGSRSSSAIA